MKKHCNNCKWWNMPDEDHEFTYGQMAGGQDHKPCDHPKVAGGSYNDASRRGSDALNTYNVVSTGPSFGCIHFKGKG